MKILIVTIYYPPVISSLSLMMQEVAESLSRKGHSVTVVTAKPHSDLNLTDNQLNSSFKTFSIENKIQIVRVNTPPLKSKFFIWRGIIQLLLPHIFFRHVNKYSSHNYDVVIISTPPLPLTKIGSMFKKKYGSKYILFVQDIYPQSLVDIGAMKNNLIIRFFEEMTQSAYNQADLITSHTRGNRDYILKNNNINKKKISFLPNWIDVAPYKNNHGAISFREKYKLESKFIFLFAGVIGLGQGVELLVKSFVKIKSVPEDLCLLIVGEGSEKKKIQSLVEDSNCKNIIFKPFVPLEDYPSLVKDVDVGVVSLDSRLTTPVVPGKLLGFMAASLPIIGLLNKQSDGHSIIKKSRCGYSINSDEDPNRINALILKFYKEKNSLNKLGHNGYKYVLKHYDKEQCLNDIHDLLYKSIN